MLSHTLSPPPTLRPSLPPLPSPPTPTPHQGVNLDFYKLRFAFVFSTRCSSVMNVLVLVKKKCGLIKTIAAYDHRCSPTSTWVSWSFAWEAEVCIVAFHYGSGLIQHVTCKNTTVISFKLKGKPTKANTVELSSLLGPPKTQILSGLRLGGLLGGPSSWGPA